MIRAGFFVIHSVKRSSENPNVFQTTFLYLSSKNCLLHNLNRTMIVAVVAVLMVQATVDDVVGVIAVRYGFMAAAFAVNVALAGVDGMAAVGIGFIDA